MARDLLPRKRASQARSRATVEALVEATARVLVSDGYDRASTNRIAEKAGVSIGSLYQYFPGKDALVAAVVDRHHRQIMGRVRAVMAEIASQPIGKGVRRLVTCAFEAHRLDATLRRVLAEQVPHVERRSQLEALDREGRALVRRYIEGRRDEIRIADLDLAAFVCGRSIETLTQPAVWSRGEVPRETEALIEETTRLITGYLRARPEPMPCSS